MDIKDLNSGNNEPGNTGKDRLKSITILAGFLIVILFGIYLIFYLKSPDTTYEILLQDTSKGQLTLQIFSKDTSESSLIEINDKLLKIHNDTVTTKFFFYFDDKQHTGKFFQLFTKPNLTPEEQNEMSHNNAMFYFEKNMINRPCLTKRFGQGWKILKCY
jgi:hypothetical protein